MPGTTLTAMQGNAATRVQYSALIEGIPFILTDGPPERAFAAYDASGSTHYATDFRDALSGLSVEYAFKQEMSPWEPFIEPTDIRLTIVPGELAQEGSLQGAVVDTFGELVFKRTGGTETELRANLDCNDATITVARVDDFAATGTVYLGPETITYSARDTGADTFTVDTRGKYCPVTVSGGGRFARTHKPLTASESSLGTDPTISTEPRTWVGRWVEVWVHRLVGSSIDTPETDQSSAHRLFCGTIVSVEDNEGATVIVASDPRRKIYETQLNRDPFRATLADGFFLAAGERFSITTSRTSNSADTVGAGNDLVVVPSGASGTNQIDEGRYTPATLNPYLNAWIQGERAAARTLFNIGYSAMYTTVDGTRGFIHVTDPTAGAGPNRRVTITCSTAFTIKRLGWSSGRIEYAASVQSASITSDEAPRRFDLSGPFGAMQTITLTEPTGTWVSQATLLPPSLQDSTNLIDGVLKVGDLGYVRARRISDTSFQVTEVGLEAFFPDQASDALDSMHVSVDDEFNAEVAQVILIERSFKEVLLKILLSTGTSGFNHATWDAVNEAIACGIPYSAIGGDDFVADVDLLAESTATCCAIIKPADSFAKLFQADFLLRRCALVWGNGRLNVKTWSSPTSTYATTALTETTKASPPNTRDLNRASVTEEDDYKNVVRIKFNIDAEGAFRDEITLRDAPSIREHGERSITIEARNSFRRANALGSPLDSLIASFAGFFKYTARPWLTVRRSVDINTLETLLPGTVVTLTDKYVRDPATGKRYSLQTGASGLSGYPGLVTGLSFDPGGVDAGHDGPPTVRAPLGEVSIMISPQRTIPVYVPCAEVDSTAANAGYDSGTKTLTCLAHAHSESSEVADATRFVATDKVLVIQIDPGTAGSAQSWADTVASQTGNTITLTTGLAGYDTTGATLYRVIYDDYTTATATQKAKCYQADDADGLVANAIQAYGFASFAVSQSNTATSSTGQEAPSRYATDAYGDGQPLDVGYERDAERLANNLVHYKTAPQTPTMYSEVRDFTGGGTWQLVEIMPVFLGMGGIPGGLTRLLTCAPRIRSTDGTTAEIRVTLGRRRPTGATRDDVTRTAPYVSVTYTSASTTASISTAQTIDISHCKLTDTLLGGVGWLYAEIKTKTELTGLPRLKLGAFA